MSQDYKTRRKSKLKDNYKQEALIMAISNFENFCIYAGVNSTQLMVCIEKGKGLTLQQIANKLEIPKSTVNDICNKCFSEEAKAETKVKK